MSSPNMCVDTLTRRDIGILTCRVNNTAKTPSAILKEMVFRHSCRTLWPLINVRQALTFVGSQLACWDVRSTWTLGNKKFDAKRKIV